MKVMHKYLNQLGIKSDDSCIFNTTEIDGCGRQKKFMKEREEHGFDSRETWGLNYTFVTWLYEHLKVYMDYADGETGGMVDLNYHKANIPVLSAIPEEDLVKPYNNDLAEKYYNTIIEEHTQREAILLMINYLEDYLKNNEDCSLKDEYQAYEKATCAIKIFAEVFGIMWW